jgi:hypothetical protein
MATAVSAPTGRLMKKIQCQVDGLRESAAGQQADGAAGHRHEREAADRLRPLHRRWELRGQDGQHDSGGERTAEALHEAGGDEQRAAPRQAAQRRGSGEDQQPGEQDGATPHEVTEAPRHQEEAAEGDQVGVDYPGQGRLAEVKVLLDRRERDVHNRRVEDDHQLCKQDGDKSGPAPPVAFEG